MFEKYIEQVLKVFRYVDSALITDADGNIQYYYTRKEYINGLNEEEVIGRHILDVFSNIDNNSSTIMQAAECSPTPTLLTKLRQELSKLAQATLRPADKGLRTENRVVA